MDDVLRALLPLASGVVGIPFLLFRIYKYVDARMREQIDDLEAQVADLAAELELRRSQRITEVDAERTRRLAAEDQAAISRAAALAQDSVIKVLKSQLDRAERRGGNG